MSNPSQVITTTQEFGSCTGHTSYVHHRDFPEIRGEGESPKDAAEQLAERLFLTLDHAPSAWRRESVQKAIEDVRAFAEQQTVTG